MPGSAEKRNENEPAASPNAIEERNSEDGVPTDRRSLNEPAKIWFRVVSSVDLLSERHLRHAVVLQGFSLALGLGASRRSDLRIPCCITTATSPVRQIPAPCESALGAGRLVLFPHLRRARQHCTGAAVPAGGKRIVSHELLCALLLAVCLQLPVRHQSQARTPWQDHWGRRVCRCPSFQVSDP